MTYILSLFDELLREKIFEKKYTTSCLYEKIRMLEAENYLLFRIKLHLQKNNQWVIKKVKEWESCSRQKLNLKSTFITQPLQNEKLFANLSETVKQLVWKERGNHPKNLKSISLQYLENKKELLAEISYFRLDLANLSPSDYRKTFVELLLNKERHRAYRRIFKGYTAQTSCSRASDFLSVQLKQLDHLLREARIKQVQYQEKNKRTEAEIETFLLYSVFQETLCSLSQKLSLSFAATDPDLLANRTRVEGNCKIFYSQEEVQSKKDLLDLIKVKVVSLPLQKLVQFPVEQFLELAHKPLSEHEHLHITVFYELSNGIETYLSSKRVFKNNLKPLEEKLLPYLVKSNFSPAFILKYFDAFQEEKMETMENQEKRFYLKKLQKEYQVHQLAASSFKPYHHYEGQKPAIFHVLKLIKKELKQLSKVNSPNESKEKKEPQIKPLTFEMSRNDLAAFFLSLKEAGIISSKHTHHQIARFLETSTFFNSGKPMKHIESLLSRLNNEELLANPYLKEMQAILIHLIKNKND
ncbi:hypothetical protein [Xanthovirga aplysinae]|uniref:hypothetical protein n=1 Tax=Xanthovirga aplysinae TaxID=2529853 RepID=UPI0012BD34F1|nr:hypothetical protein [Xanthovirga aplysinae]MTI32892.1 hypothetical protein [Xanthovirga aplysinae]